MDNTLYPASCNLFGPIQDKMTAYIADRFSVPLDEAGRMRSRWFHAHGTTLAGLMADHGVDPHEFLDLSLIHI